MLAEPVRSMNMSMYMAVQVQEMFPGLDKGGQRSPHLESQRLRELGRNRGLSSTISISEEAVAGVHALDEKPRIRSNIVLQSPDESSRRQKNIIAERELAQSLHQQKSERGPLPAVEQERRRAEGIDWRLRPLENEEVHQVHSHRSALHLELSGVANYDAVEERARKVTNNREHWQRVDQTYEQNTEERKRHQLIERYRDIARNTRMNTVYQLAWAA